MAWTCAPPPGRTVAAYELRIGAAGASAGGAGADRRRIALPPGTDCSTECTAHVGKLRGGAHLELRLSPIFDGAAAAATVGSFVPLVVRTPAESGSRPRLPSSHVVCSRRTRTTLPADLVSDYMPPPVARRVITAAATPPVATATCSPACSKGVCCAAGGGAPKSCATWASAARRAPTATRVSVSSTASNSPASPASPPSTARPSSWSRASRHRRRRRPPPPSAARPTPSALRTARTLLVASQLDTTGQTDAQPYLELALGNMSVTRTCALGVGSSPTALLKRVPAATELAAQLGGAGAWASAAVDATGGVLLRGSSASEAGGAS